MKPQPSDIEWLDISAAVSSYNFQEAASQLADQLISIDDLESSWLIAYGDSSPLVMESLRLNRSVAANRPMPLGLLLIAAPRTHASLKDIYRKLRIMKRVSGSFGVMKYSGILKQIIQNELRNDQRTLAETMLKESSRSMLLKRFSWLLDWEGSRNDADQLQLPIHQLHGRGDALFETPSADDATLMGLAGQWIWFTHSKAVLQWVEAVARKPI